MPNKHQGTHKGAAKLPRLCCPLLIATILTLFSAAPHVQARTTYALPPPRAFALPPSTFPPRAAVHGASATNQAAGAASALHTVDLGRLGRQEGYLQTASWTPQAHTRRRPQPVTLQYQASLFSSPDQADAAYGDARASLWEIGHPITGSVANEPTFAVLEQGGRADAYLILHHGAIEMELRLRYSTSIDWQSLKSSLWHLRHAALAARTLALRLAAALPPGYSSPATDTLPPIFTAPWGTGPVVKSPSLMVLDSPSLDPGAFRPATGPTLAHHAARHAGVIPPAGLARFGRTALVKHNRAWYDTATLYASPRLAAQAYSALAAGNRSRPWLHPYRLDPAIWKAGRLSMLDASQAWSQDGETIFAFRLQNVLLVLVELGQSSHDVASLVDRLVTTVPTWLHARGVDLVNAGGDPVHLAALNWYGFEHPDFVVGGLAFRPYQSILQMIMRLGYNTIRLPFSNQLVEQNPIVTAHLAANPELQGLHALDILDRIVNYAGALGISVILDNHRSDAGWSAQENGLWYTDAYPDAAFVHDWVLLAQRYAVNDVVVGADLRNEPHGPATWGGGDPSTDWLAAAERAGDAVLAANPHLLIIVEGIQLYGKGQSYWWGGSLMGVATDPAILHFADGSSARSQLVYSPHDYGPDNCGGGCPWFNATTTYQSLIQVWEQYWGYITDDPSKPYAAPVWLGEFGTCNLRENCVQDTTPGSQGQWFSSLVQYIGEKHLSWAYWSANGTQSSAPSRQYGALDWYGFFDPTWTHPYPFLDAALKTIRS